MELRWLLPAFAFAAIVVFSFACVAERLDAAAAEIVDLRRRQHQLLQEYIQRPACACGHAPPLLFPTNPAGHQL